MTKIQNDYRKLVKHRLIDLGMTSKDLQRSITEKTGLYCDDSNLLKALDGRINSKNIITAINEILDLNIPIPQ